MAIAAIFDTYKAVLMLEKRGLSKSAAEGITELLKDVTETNLVTKADLKELRHDIETAMSKQTVSLLTWITGMLLAQGALVVALLQYLQ